jgi:twitching motility protein PilT
MKTVDELLRELGRSEVLEFAVVSDRLPCVKVGDAYEPVDDSARSTDAILEMLAAVGGSRHVEELDAKPAQWTTRIDGVGIVAVHAVMRGGRVQARFTVVRRISLSPLVAVRRSRPPLRHATGRASKPAPIGAIESVAPPPPAVPSEFVAGDGVSEPLLRAAVIKARPAGARPEAVALRPVAQPEAVALRPGARSEAVALRSAGRAEPAAPRAGETPSIDDLFAFARASGASDLHVVAGRPVLLRLGGELAPKGVPLDADVVERMLRDLVPERLRAVLDEHGSCDFAVDRSPHGRFRANVSRQRSGYKGSFRCIAATVPTLASLGLPPEIGRATEHHQGLVLVTGPTGHGKTSTLAAIVDIINTTTTHHVITVEDPIEYVHGRKSAAISQREVGSHTRSFASALKASLREDPDVIVVGELRDTETVRMALAASETGHLVVGTMNTPSVAKTIDRVVDLFPPGDQQQVRMTLAGGLHLVVGQRLLPTSDGQGMAVAVELLPGSIALWNLIRDAKTYQIPSLQQRGKGFGIFRLDESLLDLVRAGRISRETAVAVAEHPEELEATLSAKKPAPAEAPPAKKAPDAASLLGKAGQLFGKKGL